MFGGTELSIGGPCIEKSDVTTIELEGVSLPQPCQILSKFIVRCVSPFSNMTGNVNVTLTVQHANKKTSKFHGILTFGE